MAKQRAVQSNLTVRLPAALHRRVRIQAVKEDRSMASLVEAALRAYLKAGSEEKDGTAA